MNELKYRSYVPLTLISIILLVFAFLIFDIKYAEYFVFFILFFCSFISIAIIIERMRFYKNIDFNLYKNRDDLEIALTKNLTTLSIIASNAPYIGLLGTVVSISLTFLKISTDADISIIMESLGMALRATALGLIVAIPATIFYNMLLRDAEVIINEAFNN